MLGRLKCLISEGREGLVRLHALSERAGPRAAATPALPARGPIW